MTTEEKDAAIACQQNAAHYADMAIAMRIRRIDKNFFKAADHDHHLDGLIHYEREAANAAYMARVNMGIEEWRP